jgi:ferredoxin
MAIKTSRSSSNGTITIQSELCTVCGRCVEVCKDFSLIIKDKKLQINPEPVFGCIGCGHCMAVCPHNAIEISGRTLTSNDLFDLPTGTEASGYGALMALLRRRRSIREFTDQQIEPRIIEQILAAARTSPMGLPPSDVQVLVFDSTGKSRAFAEDFCTYLEGMKWLVSPWFLWLMRPFWGKANHEVFSGFVKPLFKVYTEKMKEGVNVVTYDAPLAIYFYGTPYSDPADPIVAATTAMYAGESLGLGSCMLGAIHPLIQQGNRARKFREKHGIRSTSREGLFVIFGYPAVSYKKGIRRTFASEDYYSAPSEPSRP